MFHRNVAKAVLATMLLAGATGCMTIFNGTSQQVNVVTYPIRAPVKVVDKSGRVVYEGPTPAQVKLSRSQTYEIIADAAGYRPAKVVAVPRRTRDNIWGSVLTNMFTTGGVGLFVDLGTGSLKSFDEEGIEVTLLREKRSPSSDVGDSVDVLLTLDADDEGQPLVFAELLH